MYAIETSLGRFEADDEKTAKAKLRKARREQDKKDAEANARYKVARLRAEATAYAIYDKKMRGEKMPVGWMLYPVTTEGYCVHEYYDAEACQRAYAIDTGDTTVSVRPYDRITHFVMNGAGFCIAISIEKQDCELFAVGAEGDCAAWVPLWNVKADDFRKSKTLDAS